MQTIITIREGRRPGKWEAQVEGQLLCTSRQPFLAAARVLLQQGCDPTTRIIMRHDGSEADSLCSTIGEAAKLSVTETGSAPVFSQWEPFDRSRFAT